MLEVGDGASRDIPRARSLYERSCRAGLAQDCYALGRLAQRLGERSATLDAFGKGCDAGSAVACYDLAQALGLGPNTAKALALFEKACAGGHQAACERARKLKQ
jgi:TPR repeat protein